MNDQTPDKPIVAGQESLSDEGSIDFIRSELAKAAPSNRRRIIQKFTLAALGSIPWVGGFISAAISLRMEKGELKTDSLQTGWLEEHTEKLEALQSTLNDIIERFTMLGSAIDERIESEEYLSLVRRVFRTWDRADTEEKRRYVANLISNAAGTRLCSDDVVRLFIDWLDKYDEAHFAVIREIYRHPGITRYEIWQEIHGEFPREDSAEADLFRLLIHDLSTGRVIRQDRAKTADGRFLRERATRARRPASPTVETSFEDTKPYVLSSLGKQFVHYTMNEVVPRIGE